VWARSCTAAALPLCVVRTQELAPLGGPPGPQPVQGGPQRGSATAALPAALPRRAGRPQTRVQAGGPSRPHLLREVLESLWPGGAQPDLFDLAEVGVRLRSPAGAPLAIRMELRGILADHVALSAGLCLKGHSGTKFCHLCQNAVEAEVAGGSGEWLARASGRTAAVGERP
jgi:hypothetical protein